MYTICQTNQKIFFKPLFSMLKENFLETLCGVRLIQYGASTALTNHLGAAPIPTPFGLIGFKQSEVSATWRQSPKRSHVNGGAEKLASAGVKIGAC
jgi:hypothetical protein